MEKWRFQEVARSRGQLKEMLSRVEDLTLVEMEKEARGSCDFFKSFQDDGQGTFDFLQHFMRVGSVLINPCLEHFADTIGFAAGMDETLLNLETGLHMQAETHHFPSSFLLLHFALLRHYVHTCMLSHAMRQTPNKSKLDVLRWGFLPPMRHLRTSRGFATW